MQIIREKKNNTRFFIVIQNFQENFYFFSRNYTKNSFFPYFIYFFPYFTTFYLFFPILFIFSLFSLFYYIFPFYLFLFLLHFVLSYPFRFFLFFPLCIFISFFLISINAIIPSIICSFFLMAFIYMDESFLSQ